MHAVEISSRTLEDACGTVLRSRIIDEDLNILN
jgi:hypothetical protein